MSNKRDSLGDRMKAYEAATEFKLVENMPIIARIDGKAFHTFTKGMVKPFDIVIENTMKATMRALCADIPGALIGYTQSDEITILIGYDKYNESSFYNGRIVKISTVLASKATRYFNKYFCEEVNALINWDLNSRQDEYIVNRMKESLSRVSVYERRLHCAEFDCRVFNVPEWDVINNFIYRQQDAIRNSIQMVGHVNYTTRELNKVNSEGIKQKLLNERDIDWDQYPVYNKQGAFCIRDSYNVNVNDKVVTRHRWIISDRSDRLQDDRQWFSDITSYRED